MANINLSPNPNGSEVSLGGSFSGDVRPGTSFSMSFDNVVETYNTNTGLWGILYVGGWQPKTQTCTGKIKDTCDYISRVACVLNGSDQNPDTDFSVDGVIDASDMWNVGIQGIYGWNTNYNRVDNIQFDTSVWDNLELITTVLNQDGTSTTTTTVPNGFRFTYTPAAVPASGYAGEPRCTATINIPFPVFKSQAECDAYLETGDDSGRLNPEPVIPDTQEYEYYMYNIKSSNGGGKPYTNLFYRYKMVSNGRLALYKIEDTSHKNADRCLIGLDNIDKIYFNNQEYLMPVYPESSSTERYFLGQGRRWESGEWYWSLMYNTNIFTFENKADAEEYILTGDASKAIDQWRETGTVDPEIGEPTDQTEQGENGAVFSYGNHIYRMSNVQMATLFNEVFNTDPTITQALLDGLQLFGSNQINAIHDIMYLPLSVNDIATLSGTTNITIGTYTMQNAQGDPVIKNDKMINMGSHFFAAPYGAGDYRNFAPYCRAYVMLPYAGTHELQIDKYINKYVTIKLAVDVTTGAGTYYIYGGQTIFDTFDCIIGAHRPITAVDHASHVSATTNAILQTLPSVGQAVVSVGNPTAGGVASAASNTAGAILKGYEAMNTAVNAPMTERGSFHGFVSMFDVTSPYFIFAQMQTKAPQNLLMLKGKPSSAGGKLSSFWGRFEAAEVDLPSFSGTQAEAEELISILKGGIYID